MAEIVGTTKSSVLEELSAGTVFREPQAIRLGNVQAILMFVNSIFEVTS